MKTATVDKVRLIKLIQKRPLLWKTPDSYDSKHFQLTNKLWKDIANKMGFHTTILKKKWARLRSYFRQEIKTATNSFTKPFDNDAYVSKNRHYKMLSFLLEDVLLKENCELVHNKSKYNKKRQSTLAVQTTIKPQRKSMLNKSISNKTSPKKSSIKRSIRLVNASNISTENPSSEHQHDNIPQYASSSIDTTQEITPPIQPLLTIKSECQSESRNENGFMCSIPHPNEALCLVSDVQFSNSVSDTQLTSGSFNVSGNQDDYLFLISCLTKLNALTPSRNMYIRYKILELFYKEFNSEHTS